MATNEPPRVGQHIYYYAYGTPGGEFPAGVPRAAVITEVDEPDQPDSPVGLCVFNPTGLFFNRHIKRTRRGEAGCWDYQTEGGA